MVPVSLLDLNEKSFGGLEKLFPGWDGPKERLCVYSPHDDDAVLGAGYVMRAALDAGAQVNIFIVCSGDCGYSVPEERDTIVEVRHREMLACYRAFGIPEENIVCLNYPDFSALSYIGRRLPAAEEGHFRTAITELRKRRITRILAPNPYHEHTDHLAAYMMAAYDAPQAGDMHSVDWADPYCVRSTAVYSVWAELDPEDALVAGRACELRANTLLIAPQAYEDAVLDAVRRFSSQDQIIEDLMRQRRARALKDGRLIEVYQRIDPRPPLSFEPYKDLLNGLS